VLLIVADHRGGSAAVDDRPILPEAAEGEGRWAYEPKFDGFLYLTLVPG
jgi:hypothetical protein